MKKTIFYTIVLISTILVVHNASAQNKTVITGKVVSKSDGEPLVGVTVAEKDKSNRIITGVITDFNGAYVIKVSDSNNTLSFAFLGYETQNLVPGEKRSLDVELKETILDIDEVVIRADKKVNTGEFNIDKSRIASAIQTISAKEVSEVSTSDVIDQLQGRLSGVDIVANSGEPGAGMSIRIRGTSSLSSSSEPLIVINGVIFDTEVDDDFDFSSADEDEYSALIGVSADDIEEISVLKDAAATAQYGSEGANGVLLIKTKRGARGKAQFSYSYKSTFGWQPEGMDMLNGSQYSTLMKDINLTRGKNAENYDEINYDPSYEYYEYYNKNTNWIEEITQTGITHQHQFSVSGGGEKALYRISASAKNQEGTTVGTGSDVYTARSILDYNISDKLTISTELAYSHSSVDKSKSGLRALALVKMPNMSVYELDSEGNPTDTYFTPIDNIQGDGDDYYNPVAMANLYTYNVENNRITPVFKIRYQPLGNVTYSGNISYDTSNNKTSQHTPEEALGTYWSNTSNNYSYFKDSEFSILSTRSQLVWEPDLGKNHSLFVGGIFTTYDKKSQGYAVATSNSPSTLESVVVDANIEDGSLGSSSSDFRRVGWNLSFNYMFLDRYVFSGSARYEGNSRFGDKYRYGFFPSISGRWIVSKENFMKPIKFINEFSLRASYGQNGNAPSMNYGAYNTYATYSYDYLDMSATYPSSIELRGLKWETVVQNNIGFNLTCWNHRINADFEYYVKTTKDMLVEDSDIPSTSGFSSLDYINQGDMENKGWELSVYSRLVNTKDFKFNFNFVLSRNENVITKIVDGMDVEDGDPLVTGEGGYLKRLQEGLPIGSFYGYRYEGVYSTSDDLYAYDANGNIIYDIDGTAKIMMFNNSYEFSAGDAKYKDMNHDGNINRLDVVYLGNANPLLYGGFGPNVTYKNFQFNAYFNFRYKQDLINIARMNTESMDDWDNQNTATLRRWRSEGDETDIPRAYYGSQVNTLGSDRFLEDASYLRLKSITFRYNFSKRLISKIGLRKLSVYATGTNLLTFTEYLGCDPETGSDDDWQDVGYDNNKTPRSKQLTLGIQVQF